MINNLIDELETLRCRRYHAGEWTGEGEGVAGSVAVGWWMKSLYKYILHNVASVTQYN